MSAKSFLFGYSIVKSDKKNAEKIINMCYEGALRFSDVRIEGDEMLFCIPLFSERRLIRLAKGKSIEITVVSRRGVPSLLLRYRHRAGILAGLAVSIAMIVFSSSVIWDIRIDGASRVSERDLLAVFAECGLEVGAKIKDIDADVLENQILILSDDISWVSVNLSNNVANVEIRELDYATPDEYGDALYSNVVASQDGVIVGFEDVRGNISVEIGEAVCRNQLLISGIFGDESNPFRLTNAHGLVFAEVEDTIEIKISNKYIKKVTKESVKSEKSLIFFKNEIKFFSNSRNSPPTCDKIYIVENFYTINGKRLPVAIKTAKYIEYEEQEIVRTKNEMRALAYSQLYRHIDTYYADAEILSRSVSITENESETILVCNLKCIKNIAQIKEIMVS